MKLLIENNITNVGIYEIRCIKTNKVYIGSSKNIQQRVRDHVNELRKNKHGNNYLQKAWRKHREGGFVFKCLENLPRRSNYKRILNIEQKYLDSIKPWQEKIGFNINRIADRPPHKSGVNHGMYGKHHTEEARAKMRVPRPSLSAANKGKTMSERLGREWINPLKGKKRTGWVSPCLDQTPLTLKHIDGLTSTKLKSVWSAEKVRYSALLSYTKRNKFGTSKGWFYCPYCCNNEKAVKCVCNDHIQGIKYKFRKLQSITLINEQSLVQTRLCIDWLKKYKVDIGALKAKTQKTSRGWRLYN